MLIYIKILLFLLSSLGFWEFICRKTAVNIYYIPSIAIALQVSILIVSGLLNCLNEFSNLLYISGLGYLLYFIYKERSVFFLKKYVNIGYIFTLCSFVFLIVLLKEKVFLHFDNFSHWAIVLKPMLGEQRFPNFTDKIIMFTQYPLVSAK